VAVSIAVPTGVAVAIESAAIFAKISPPSFKPALPKSPVNSNNSVWFS
jgi:hypothetical protein